METQIENQTKTPNQLETTERKENSTENTNANSKCQADVLNQARLRPLSVSSKPKITNCLIKIASSRLSDATVKQLY